MALNLIRAGATYATGKFGQALSGGNPNVGGFNLTLPCTIEATVKTTATALQVIAGFALTGTFNLYLGTDANTGNLICATNPNGGSINVVATRSVNDGAFHAVAAVVTSGGITLYVDGVACGSGSQGLVENNADNLTVGALLGNSYPFSGIIDDLRISNVARYSGNYTPSSSAFVSDANTIALYHFNGNTITGDGAPTPINIGCIGDSITFGINGNPVQAMSDYLSDIGYAPTLTNKAVSGTTSQDWLPGGSYLPGAISAFSSAGVTIVTIMLGTNDTRVPYNYTPAQHNASMKQIVAALRAAGFKVVLHHPIWTVPNAGKAAWSSDPNSSYRAFYALNAALADNVNVFIGDLAGFSFFAANLSYLADGVHPTAAGSTILGQLWAMGVLYRYGLPAGAGGGIPNRWVHS